MSYADNVLSKFAILFASKEATDGLPVALFLSTREVELLVQIGDVLDTSIPMPPCLGQPFVGIFWGVPVYEARILGSGQAITLPSIEHLESFDLQLGPMPQEEQFDVEL